GINDHILDRMFGVVVLADGDLRAVNAGVFVALGEFIRAGELIGSLGANHEFKAGAKQKVYFHADDALGFNPACGSCIDAAGQLGLVRAHNDISRVAERDSVAITLGLGFGASANIQRRAVMGTGDADVFIALRGIKQDLVSVVVPYNALVLVLRQIERRHLVRVVHATGYNGTVRIAFQAFDNNFLADMRDEHGTPGLARPVLRHAHPARAVFIAFAVAVPVKLHLYAAVIVRID